MCITYRITYKYIICTTYRTCSSRTVQLVPFKRLLLIIILIYLTNAESKRNLIGIYTFYFVLYLFSVLYFFLYFLYKSICIIIL